MAAADTLEEAGLAGTGNGGGRWETLRDKVSRDRHPQFCIRKTVQAFVVPPYAQSFAKPRPTVCMRKLCSLSSAPLRNAPPPARATSIKSVFTLKHRFDILI